MLPAKGETRCAMIEARDDRRAPPLLSMAAGALSAPGPRRKLPAVHSGVAIRAPGKLRNDKTGLLRSAGGGMAADTGDDGMLPLQWEARPRMVEAPAGTLPPFRRMTSLAPFLEFPRVRIPVAIRARTECKPDIPDWLRRPPVAELASHGSVLSRKGKRRPVVSESGRRLPGIGRVALRALCAE